MAIINKSSVSNFSSEFSLENHTIITLIIYHFCIFGASSFRCFASVHKLPLPTLFNADF